MPKKLTTNSKAQEARERKEAVKKEKKTQEEKAREDAKWVDQGTTATEKRKAEAEARRLEEQKKREAKKALQAKEEAELSKVKTVKVATHKVTRAQLLEQEEMRKKEEAIREEVRRLQEQRLQPQIELKENINRKLAEEKKDDSLISASSLDEAVQALAVAGISGGVTQEEIDRHPEKRMKAAFMAYEEREMPLLKEEYPGLKLSQYKERLWERWQKSPENPINQARARAAAQAAAE